MCGILLVYNSSNVISDLNEGINPMEHRGGEFSGIAINQPNPNFLAFAGRGTIDELYSQMFNNENFRMSLPRCKSGIGQTKYSTISTSSLKNAQPVKYGN